MNIIKHTWLYYIRRSPSYRMQYWGAKAIKAMSDGLEGKK